MSSSTTVRITFNAVTFYMTKLDSCDMCDILLCLQHSTTRCSNSCFLGLRSPLFLYMRPYEKGIFSLFQAPVPPLSAVT